MRFTSLYKSPLGDIVLESDEEALTGLWFEGQKHCAIDPASYTPDPDSKILSMAARWLDIYFSGEEPDFDIPVLLEGTEFQKEVWRILQTIPFGATMSYSEIAKAIADKRGIPKMSAQAVGSAVSRNRISIIIPCHRVIGSDKSLTGYAAGLDRKLALLLLENPDFTYRPAKGAPAASR